jgi:hypothetical protein
MSEQKLNITGSGNSQLNIGNAVQSGRDAVIRGDVQITSRQLNRQLLEALSDTKASAEETAAVKPQLQELTTAIAENPPDASRVQRALATIKEHHAWAFPVIAATLNRVIPWIAALL